VKNSTARSTEKGMKVKGGQIRRDTNMRTSSVKERPKNSNEKGGGQ